VECEHLAFRDLDVDWQIWIEVGDKPLPRKYVITSKAVGGAPQYTLRMRDWKTNVTPAADAFSFKPPEGASGVSISVLTDIDEIPDRKSSRRCQMNMFKHVRPVLVALAAGAALFGSGEQPGLSGSFVSQAEARIGRPATPMSYAGVARRTTRRAAVAGAAVAGGAYYYGTASSCYQVVNSYGQIVTRCP
jgi:hypothetical protein